MVFHFFYKMCTLILLLVGLNVAICANAVELNYADDLLADVGRNMATAPENAKYSLEKLQHLESTLNKNQKEKYYLYAVSLLGFRGKYKDQVSMIQSVIGQIDDPNLRARYLYNLTDAFVNLGEYEKALATMNDSIILLPKLVDASAKIDVLQAAVSLLLGLHAYDEAMLYADRMYAMEPKPGDNSSKCIGIADQVEINFTRGDSQKARSLLKDAMQICDADDSHIITLFLKALAIIDSINIKQREEDVNAGLTLLSEFKKRNETSDYVTQLEESIARAYLKNADLQQAERYGLQAYQHAQNSKVLQMMEKTSETMAKIKRAQGDMASALDYYDINLALKKKVLDDQLHKNLAYQRVKFDTQDKVNQLTLLEQKNKILGTEKKLEQRNNQNLLMLIALGAILMAILSAWTFKILKQKNLFRLSSQIDGLTQVSNRAYFVDCGTQQFEKTSGSISVILFDMDHFKNINDSFGHAVGDWVLKTVSERVKALLPDGGMLGRLGGEEFAICLPKLDQHQAQALAERCRLVIAAIDSNPSGFAFPVSASFGVASRGMRDLKEFEDTLAAADKALYFSKTEGRNRVSLYQ